MSNKKNFRAIKESDGTLTVVMGTETRPPSPEPPSSPCPSQHTITPLGDKEGLQGREGKLSVVDSVHNCSPLNAAVIMDDVEMVKNILSVSELSNDELSNFDCSGSPPICEAAYHNRYEIMQLLLQDGRINVNTVNLLGLTPLCIAAGNTLDNPKMTEILLSKNADVNIRAKDGRSSLHIAAEGGRYRIVRRLLGANILNDTLTCLYKDSDIFCPIPVIFAAANEHENITEQLLNHCPHAYSLTTMRDTKLLLWARKTLLSAVNGVTRNFNDELAVAAFQTYPVLDSDGPTQIPPAYGNQQEISKVEDVNAFSSMPLAEGVCARVFQSLIIIERNLGFSNKLVSTCIGQAIHVFKMYGKYETILQLLARIFDGISLMERSVLSRGFYMMPSHLHVTLSFFLAVQFWKRIRELTEANHTINFVPFINGLMINLDTILSLKEKQPCHQIDHFGEAFQTDFTHLLALLACALLNLKTSIRSNKSDIHEVGLLVAAKYDSYASANFTSLIHLAIRKAGGITEILKCSGMGGKNAVITYSLLIENLLHWGCSKYLNIPYKQYFCKGELPLHMAVRLAEMDPCYLQIVDTLLCHGAHYDGVASSGLIPSMIATRDHLKSCFDLSPLPLACLTSKAIINHGLLYQDTLCLPMVVKRFIAYHDSTTVHQ